MEVSNGSNAIGSEPEALWLKRILLPFWISRCLLLIMMGTAYIAAIYWISQEVNIKGGLLAETIILILLNVFCVSLDVVSIILLARNALHPRAFLIFQIIETTIWTVLLILEVVAAIRALNTRNFLSWFISIMLYLSFIGLLIYASIIYHRSRSTSKSGDYEPTANVVTSSDGTYNHSHPLTLANPFDNAYATHSRTTSSTSQNSDLSPSLPGIPTPLSGRSTPRSQDSFAMVTYQESAELGSLPSNPNLYRYA